MKIQNIQNIFGPQNKDKGSPTSWLLLYPSAPSTVWTAFGGL